MKTSSLIAAVLFAGAATAGVVYADDKATAPKAAEAQTDNAAARPHSHVQEKTGIPQSMPDPKAVKPNPATDRSRHYHPRDGK
ncbi:MAG: hypothetical protein IPH41_11345 [Sulfuritalea sp.]|jgi:hypothetical protein|nr:hypothetical protein [Sulfuritalea sp.]